MKLLRFHLLLLLIVGGICLHNNGLTFAEYSRVDFPSDFVFGAGTSAYQVEGAAFEDGRTASIFDTFAHAYLNGDGDIACDGYHKYKEDIQLMVDTGLEAFKFSISWSRLIPNGTGPINPMGLQFYNNFIDELIRNGIEPHVMLCHSDLPQILEDKYGGWLSRESVYKSEPSNIYYPRPLIKVTYFSFGRHIVKVTTSMEIIGSTFPLTTTTYLPFPTPTFSFILVFIFLEFATFVMRRSGYTPSVLKRSCNFTFWLVRKRCSHF